jgi:hypothetical protein
MNDPAILSCVPRRRPYPNFGTVLQNLAAAALALIVIALAVVTSRLKISAILGYRQG